MIHPVIRNSLEMEPLRAPRLRQVIQSLDLPAGSCGLDAGCGIGLQACLLAEVVGPGGHITGIDLDPALIQYGNGMVHAAGLAERITLRPADANRLPFEAGSFDWIWSADCIGYPVGDLAAALRELIRVTRPGGSLNLLGWSSQQILPGCPFLEARLNATCSGYLPYLQNSDPRLHFTRALHAFREAGLTGVRAQTFAGDVQAPLSPAERAALICLFEMLWGQRQPEVSEADWLEYQRLCRPDSPDFILDVPGYYAFFTYTVFTGAVTTDITDKHG